MSGWDILNSIINGFPPVAAAVLIASAGVIFIIGFSKHGTDFIKHGFKQMVLNASLEKRFDDLVDKIDAKFDNIDAKFDKIDIKFNEIDAKMDGFKTELVSIKVNHFGHLKNFLTELTSILVDKSVLNNQDKARLDNQLRGM